MRTALRRSSRTAPASTLGPVARRSWSSCRRDGTYTLAWRGRAFADDDVREYFVDARTGDIAFEYSNLQTQSAVGRGTGVLGDTKKVSVMSSGGQFVASDKLRPPSIETNDLKGDHLRTASYLNGITRLTANDLASDSDNTWTDAMTVDAHVYIGWTYDYYFKRFGRRGLDNRDRSIVSIVHPARRQDVIRISTSSRFSTPTPPISATGSWFSASACRRGSRSVDAAWDYSSGSLDLVAHELTHGVTDYSSRLIYLNESGALNEAFSDIMGTSVEFFFQEPGNGNMRADYLFWEDTVKPAGVRSLADPLAYGNPDHYSRRFTGTADNGGVHSNSGIANQAFYLAIEGGTNRTSGLSVQGVGARTASRSSACSIGRSRRCCRRTPRSRSRVWRPFRRRAICSAPTAPRNARSPRPGLR